MAVQDVFREHGYSVEKDSVVLIEENGKLTVAMDVSNSIAADLSDDILERIVAIDLALLNTTLEMNLFGAAVGVLFLLEFVAEVALEILHTPPKSANLVVQRKHLGNQRRTDVVGQHETSVCHFA